MSDTSHPTSRHSLPRDASASADSRRSIPAFAPYACVVVGTALGLAIGHRTGGDAGAFEPSLALLLRFMAGVKLLAVLAAAGVLHWRFTRALALPLAAAYLATLTAMALAPGLIWSLAGIAPGAVAFHAGLLAFLFLAWRDDAVQLPRRLSQRRSVTAPAPSGDNRARS